MSTPNYVALGCKSWNRETFERLISKLPGKWTYWDKPDQLTVEAVTALKPEALFFLHWSHKVPDPIVSNFNCICFHMTDLPYGRGGSPLQNLIARGHRDTKLSAFRMTEQFDAGPIYLKEPLSLEGTAAEIYRRASDLSGRMIERIVRDKIQPKPQTGPVVLFTRRRPDQSRITGRETPEELYDLIRMLDAEGYPSAFCEIGNLRVCFRSADKKAGAITATVEIVFPESEAKENDHEGTRRSRASG